MIRAHAVPTPRRHRTIAFATHSQPRRGIVALAAFAAASAAGGITAGCIGDAPPVASQGATSGSGGSGGSSTSTGGGGATSTSSSTGGAPASCTDQALNGDETDVDCGGSLCAPCANGKSCKASGDCASGACTMNKCAPWSKSFGASNGDDEAFGVAFDSQGNIVVVGDFGGTVDFGGGNVTAGGASSGFLVKYSPTGAFLWAKTFGASNGAHGFGVLVMPNDDVVLAGTANDQLDFGGGVLIGKTGSNAILARYTSAGQYVWAQGFPCGSGSCGAIADAIALAPGDDIFVTGQAVYAGIDFGGGAIPGYGDNDIFVARLKGTDGTPVWSKLFGGSGADFVSGIAATKDGDVVLSGHFFNDTIDFGGPSATSTYWDIFLVRLQGGSGDYVWSKTFNGGFNDQAGMVRVDSANNIVFGGEIEGAGDLGGGPISVPGLKGFVAKYGPDGTFTWARVSNPDGYAYAYSVALDASDGVVAVGSFQSATVGFGGNVINNVTGVGDDMFIAKYSATSAPLFSAGYGGAGADAFRCVAVFPPTGNVVAVGYFQQTVDVGDGPRVSNGMNDAIIASLGTSVP